MIYFNAYTVIFRIGILYFNKYKFGIRPPNSYFRFTTSYGVQTAS